jgi:hypothetical protein
MPSHRLFRWLTDRSLRCGPEPSRLIVGSTGSGKSEGELVDLVRLANRGDVAVVLLDGHGPLAFRAAGHWAARGHEGRIVYEPLRATDRALCWEMLPRSAAPRLPDRRIEDAETRDEVAQCFLAQRNLASLADRAWTKEWMEAAIDLCLAQPETQPLPALLDAFRIGTPRYERLLLRCDREEIVTKFRSAERLRSKSEVQYQIETGAARRFFELVCTSEVVRLRCRPGPFDWLSALRGRRLIAFDGGGVRSTEIKRTLFLLAGMQVIHAVRRHFAQKQQPLPVVLVLEEAGALGLVTPFVVQAMQELRKAGLAVHLITQSSLDFADRGTFEALLSHAPWQGFYQCLSPADQEVGARALANATFDARAVHYTRDRAVQDGVERVETASHGASYDPRTHETLRRDGRTATALRPRYRKVADAYYKSPLLHEQEFRTKLATLRVGERLVRDRGGVRCERVRPVRAPWGRPVSDASTRALIDRLRDSPIYLPCPSADPAPATHPPDAAARLRAAGGGV